MTGDSRLQSSHLPDHASRENSLTVQNTVWRRVPGTGGSETRENETNKLEFISWLSFETDGIATPAGL